jgi:hypothetical protein
MTFSVKKIIFFVVVIAFITFRYFLYADFASGCFIKLPPSLEFSNNTIIKSLKLLKNASPVDYHNVCKRVGTINTGNACGGFGGGCFYSEGQKIGKGKIYVSIAQGELAEGAGIIVHETCHVQQNTEGRAFDENECYREDDRIFKKIVMYK